jgi:hypothetical protein
MTINRDPLPIGRHARADWLRAQAEECIREADMLKAAGELLEAMAFVALAQDYAELARTRATETGERADG